MIILFIATLFSCVTEKKRQEICASCPVRDSVSYVRVDSLIVRDSTFFFTIEGDTVWRDMPCPEMKPFEVKKKKTDW